MLNLSEYQNLTPLPEIAFKNTYDECGFFTLMEQFGPVIRAALRATNVEEIMLNADGSVFVESKLTGIEKIGTLSSEAGKSIIRSVASLLDQEINENCPILSCDIPYQHVRFEGLLPPLVSGPTFSIRKRNPYKVSLDTLMDSPVLTHDQGILLRHIVCEHKNIVIAGATGSGKTTIANALINEVALLQSGERIICIEDTPELDIDVDNKIKLLTTPQVGMATLLKSALRLRPDRIIVGEVRSVEALDLIDALSTGHGGGITTIHAGSVLQALHRLSLLISRNPLAPKQIEATIAQAIDIVILIDKRPQRHVAKIMSIWGYKDNQFILKDITNANYYEDQDLYR